MSEMPDALWLVANPQLKRFDKRLCERLNQQASIQYWEYCQTADEPCCLDTAITLLHEYLQQQSQPLHLIGHGFSGVIGLLYTRQYPQHVRSLTLLSVGDKPAYGWHAYYYSLRQSLQCSRAGVLHKMAGLLFGPQPIPRAAGIAKVLARVLDSELAPHSLGHCSSVAPGGIAPPLLLCHGSYDVVLDASTQVLWRQWLKPSDRLWSCPNGRHFFHYEYPHRCSQIISDFWQQTTCTPRDGLSLAGIVQ